MYYIYLYRRCRKEGLRGRREGLRGRREGLRGRTLLTNPASQTLVEPVGLDLEGSEDMPVPSLYVEAMQLLCKCVVG